MGPSVAAQDIEAGKALLQSLIGGVVKTRASDVHLRAGSSPFIRVDGRLTKVPGVTLAPQMVEVLLTLTSARLPQDFGAETFEFSFEQPGIVRFRGHAFRESGHWAISLRSIPPSVPTFHELRLPPVVKTLCEVQPGLTLITGPTGSGKSTTAAAMLRAMAMSESLHVVTVEDPVEYTLHETPSCISQREVGRDTASFASAARAAFREDPDVLFIGEIRDHEALEVALQAAESGTAVLSTFHTATAVKTIQRVVSMCSTEEQAHIRARLADVLRAVVSQRLLPKRGTKGRVVCCEVMLNNFTVKDCIRDAAKTQAIPGVLERAADQQMQTFDKNLVALVREGLVAQEVGLSYAVAPNDVRRLLNVPGLVG